MKKKAERMPPISIRASEQLAAALRRIRKLRGLSQVKLANKASVTQAMISRLETRPEHVEISTVLHILHALNAELVIGDRTDSGDPLRGLL